MSDDQGEFRKLAQESLYEAERASNGRDREHWLKVVKCGLSLRCLDRSSALLRPRSSAL